MDVVSVALAQFEAGHISEACGEQSHGHSWTARVEVTGPLDPKTGRVRGSEALDLSLRTLVGELHLRTVNAMLPGVSATPEGIAAWISERLSLGFPWISAVEVTMGPFSAGRVIRQSRL